MSRSSSSSSISAMVSSEESISASAHTASTSSQVLDEISALDKDECRGWRSREYLERRRQILAIKNRNDKLKHFISASPSPGSNNNNNQKKVSPNSLVSYLSWRKILLQRQKRTFLKVGVTEKPLALHIENGLDPNANDNTDNDADTTASSETAESPRTTAIGSSSPNQSLSETYAFVGMHHIFECSSAVAGEGGNQRDSLTCLKFANAEDADTLAFGTSGGTLFVAAELKQTPPQIVVQFKAHTRSISDLDWSPSNDYLITCSLDRTIKVWSTNHINLASYKILRSFALQDAGESAICCRFSPHATRNLVVVGTAQDGTVRAAMGAIRAFNLSTGKEVQTIRFKSAVTSIAFSEHGDCMVAATGRGEILVYSHSLPSNSGSNNNNNSGGNNNSSSADFSAAFSIVSSDLYKLQLKMSVTESQVPITSIAFTNNFVGDSSTSSYLLVNSFQDCVNLYKLDIPSLRSSSSSSLISSSPLLFSSSKPKLTFASSFPIKHHKLTVRSIFCPLASYRSGSCLVSASEDGAVYIFDSGLSSSSSNSILKKNKLVNKLMGHAAAVLDVSFNCDESLLASGDVDGTVILWKRAQLK